MSALKISKKNQEDILVWKRLQAYPAWKRVVAELKIKIKEADMIINSIGADSKAEYSKRDIAIIKKNAYLDLIEMPETNITILGGTGTQATETMDPYNDSIEDEEFQDDDI